MYVVFLTFSIYWYSQSKTVYSHVLWCVFMSIHLHYNFPFHSVLHLLIFYLQYGHIGLSLLLLVLSINSSLIHFAFQFIYILYLYWRITVHIWV